MADLDDLYGQIPTADIARRLGVDQGEVDSAVQQLVPVLIGGLQRSAEHPDQASTIESAANDHAARGPLDSGVAVDQVDDAQGDKAINRIFGGNDASQVAAALANAGADDNDLLQKLLPILTPIVLAYIGKQLSQQKASSPGQHKSSGGALDEVLGGILGGMSGGGGDKSLGSVLGKALGSKAGDILGGLLGGKKK